MCALLSARVIAGLKIKFTPAASAKSVSRERRLLQAMSIVTSDDEQAVSIDTLGPRKFSTYDSRFARIA